MLTLLSLNIITSGDENHLCGASLRKNHKIPLQNGMGLQWYPKLQQHIMSVALVVVALD